MRSDLQAPDTSLPQYPLRHLHPSARRVWCIKLLLLGALPLFAALIYDATNLFADEPFIPTGLTSISVATIVAVGSFLFPRLWYRFWSYSLRGEELYLRRGIINRVSTIVPLRRIQHLDVSQDIIEREFELGKLIVHTAGTRSSDVVLPGLAFQDAEQLRDELKNFILEDTV